VSPALGDSGPARPGKGHPGAALGGGPRGSHDLPVGGGHEENGVPFPRHAAHGGGELAET